MEKIIYSDDLMKQFVNLNRENSVCQIYIPGKGKFTIVMQEEESQSITSEIQRDKELGQMIQDSRDAYNQGKRFKTTELIKSMSPKDFSK